MRIANISVTYYNGGSFTIAIGDPETCIQIIMTEEEIDRARALIADMFLSRQESLAKEIRTARPLMIELKPERLEEAPAFNPTVDTDYDDIPF